MQITGKLRLKLIDLVGGLNIYGILESLQHEQYMPVVELEKLRCEKLSTLVDLARQSTRYYSNYGSYQDLPVLTKSMINNAPSHFISSEYKGKLIKKSTSGSTGTPFVYKTSLEAQSYLWAGMLLSFKVAGYRPGDKVAFIAGSALIKKSFKHKTFYKLLNIDVYPVATLTDDAIERYLAAIKKKKTKLIYGYAMSLSIMADHMIRRGIEPPADLHGIICTSELLTEQMRANIEKAFGVEVFNQYGCNEAGIAAFECEEHNLHLISSRTIYETGSDGSLLGTDLANKASIFIKYNTGDIVEFTDETCSCGRTYPVIKNIVGRVDDIITDRKNKRIHSSFFNFLFKNDKSVKQYQVLFDDETIRVNVMADGNFSESNRLYYLDYLRKHLDFKEYEIEVNDKFYTNGNLKHTFIIDTRKHKQPAA